MIAEPAVEPIRDERDPAARWADYEALKSRIREAIPSLVGRGARLLVVSRGDESLLDIPSVDARHFPQSPDGGYAGYYPADSSAAIRHLEALRANGADHLLFPSTAFWWLTYYQELAIYLRAASLNVYESSDLVLFSFVSQEQRRDGAPLVLEDGQAKHIAELLELLLPAGASVVQLQQLPHTFPLIQGRTVRQIAVGHGSAANIATPGLFDLLDGAAAAGQRYVVLPVPPAPDAFLTLAFARALGQRYRLITLQASICVIFDLTATLDAPIHGQPHVATGAGGTP